ncbi:MAG: hypothetical protein CMF39_05500 [Legionellaceae bacterium]|nr:hypothetical protein [Legionellaceae bacterium]
MVKTSNGRRGITHAQLACGRESVLQRNAVKRRMGRPTGRLALGLYQGTLASVPMGLVIVTGWRRLQAPWRSHRARPNGKAYDP